MSLREALNVGVCGRTFRRQNDLKRHNCRDECSKLLQEERGSLQRPCVRDGLKVQEV